MSKACYFLTQNFASEAELNSSTVSSELFPLVAENLFDTYKRSKRYRSNGYFNIEPAENSIVVNEGGSNITVSLTTIEFSSRADFLSHVQQRLNDHVSTSLTYTVSIDTETKKTKISATGTFSIVSTDLNSDLCDYLGYSRIANLIGASEYLADSLVIHTEEFLIFDLGVDAIPKALLVLGDRKNGLNLTEFATIKLEGNHFDSWSSPAFSVDLQLGKSLSYVNKEGISPVGLRFWRLHIVDKANPDGFIEFNKLYLGDAYSPDRGAVQFPFNGDIDDRSLIEESEYGERFSTDRRMREKFNLEWDGLTAQEKETILGIYEEFGRAVPLYMIFDGNGAFSNVPNLYTRFVYFDSMPRYVLHAPKIFNLSCSFVEVP